MSLIEIIIEILLFVILLFGVVYGYKRGFIKAISKPVRFFASVATACWLADPISRNLVEPMIRVPVTNQIKQYLIDNCSHITPDSAEEELPTLLKFAASLLDVDVASFSPENTISERVDSLASPVIHLLSVILTAIVIYFISKLVYTILLAIVSASMKSGVLSLPNKLLGCIVTTLFAITVAWGFSVIFDFVIHSSLVVENAWVSRFEGGVIYRFFNKTNPIDILLSF